MGVRWGQAVVFLALWISLNTLTLPARAHVREASDSVVNTATHSIVGSLADGGTDLPPFLAHPSDVYLFVTAGAAYTDVRVLADPATDPRRLARALEASEPGTALAGATVEWSADSYAAAHVAQSQGRLGRLSSNNVVPIAALTASLRRAGFVPHVLLRVPRYARASGPARAHWGTRRFRWYDGHALRGVSDVIVNAAIAPSALWPLGALLLLPLLGLAVLGLSSRLGRDERRPLEARRRLFTRLNSGLRLLSVLGMAPIVVMVTSTVTTAASDLWFGDQNSATLVFSLTVALCFPLFLSVVVGKRQMARLFGKPEMVALAWLTEEEKTLRTQMQQRRALAQGIGVIVPIAAIFLVPHKSGLGGSFHFLYQLSAALIAALLTRPLRKRLEGMSRRVMDDDLTFRARRFGQLLGARPREVWVEESSRASHFASAFRDKDHIVVTRKMRDEFTPGEMDWVLAREVARMGTRSAASLLFTLSALPPVIVFLPVVLALTHRTVFGTSSASLLLSPWFPFALMGAFLVPMGLMLATIKSKARLNVRQEQEADRKALEVTGDLAAAEGALAKMSHETLPSLSAATLTSTRTGQSGPAGKAAGVLARQIALRTAAAEMGLGTGSSIRR